MSSNQGTSVGQQLLDVPLPQMVTRLGVSIADAQRALDDASIETAKQLSEETMEVIPQITRTINADGSISYNPGDEVSIPLLAMGLHPTFYEFSEATIDVKMDIKTKTERESEVSVSTEHSVNFGVYSGSIQADYKHNRKFGKTVEGTSHMRTVISPVPPPELLIPEVNTVDNRQSTNNGG